MDNIYAVVVTYNGINWIKRCLDSLCHSSVPLDIVVVDNNSTDETVTFVKDKFSHVTLIELDSNIGFGQANNIGLKMALDADANAVFLLNQDAWVQYDTVEKLYSILDSAPEYAIVSPVHFDGSGEQLDKGFRQYVMGCKLIDDLFKGPSHIEEVYELSFVNAAAWLISHNCLKVVGGFDPVFFHYGEDSDYIHRVIYHGLKLGVVPASMIFHDRGTNEICLTKERRAYWNAVNELVAMKNILVPDNEAVPNIHRYRFSFFRHIVKSFLRRMMHMTTVDESYVIKQSYMKVSAKILQVIESRKKCKIQGSIFLK